MFPVLKRFSFSCLQIFERHMYFEELFKIIVSNLGLIGYGKPSTVFWHHVINIKNKQSVMC